MTQNERPPSFDEFDARLKRLRGDDKDPGTAGKAGREGRSNFGIGLQVGIELVAGVVGGTLLGWALDRWLDTGPFLLIVFFMLGAVAGTWNAWRWLRRFSRSTEGPSGN
ncbi:MAG: AtpZ/AtpI family protein [Geminicoccaceae bacterium]